MGKSNRQTAEGQEKQSYQRAVDQGANTMGYLQGELPGATEQAKQTYGQASGAYGGMLGGTGAYDPGEYARISGQNQQNQQTGGYNNAAQLGQLKGDIGNVVSGGGYTPEELQKLASGGYDAEQQGTIRSGYGDLIKTGGIAENTADAMRRQAASGVQSVYSTLGQNLARQKAATGGNAGGETAQMARQMAQEQSKSVTGTNAQIGQLRQQGTIAGLGGLSQFETGVASGQRSGAADVAAGRRAGVGAEQSLAASQASGSLSATQADQELATGAATQRIAAAGGLTNLYNSSPGYVTSLVKGILEQQQTTGQLTAQQTQIMEELSKQPGVFSTIMSTIGTIGNIAVGAAKAGMPGGG